MKVQDKNKAIADFMELPKCERCESNCGHYKIGAAYYTPSQMEYHTSWDWLKPVIDKLFTYALAYPEQVAKIKNMSIVVKIEAAHEAVYQAIQYINNQQPGK